MKFKNKNKKQKTKNKKGMEYEIEYNNDLFMLRTTEETLSDFENSIRSKIGINENEKIRLQFKRNGKLYVLNDLEHLEGGMTIKVSNLTITEPEEKCWWNTNPNDKMDWEEKGYIETKYLQCLLRDNQQNVVDNGNEYLKKLELLIRFFGGDIKQVNKAYVLFNEKLYDSFQHYRSFLSNQQRVTPGNFKKDDWKNGNDVGQKFKFHDHYIKMAENFDWNHSKLVFFDIYLIFI